MRLIDALAALKAFREALIGNVVPPGEIIRREAVCAACPMRKRSSGVKSGLSLMLGNIANKHRLPSGVKDYVCDVCSCSLQLLLPATTEDLHQDTEAEAKKRPLTCWFKTV